jgi:hypothetical protein
MKLGGFETLKLEAGLSTTMDLPKQPAYHRDEERRGAGVFLTEIAASFARQNDGWNRRAHLTVKSSTVIYLHVLFSYHSVGRSFSVT